MTVDLSIEYPNANRKTKHLPIASLSDFNTYWKPMAERLKLELVPDFGGGLHVEKDVIPQVMKELEALKEYASVARNDELGRDEAAAIILSSIDYVLEAIKEADKDPIDVDLWFN